MSLGFLGQVTGTGNNYAIGGARSGTAGALGPLDFFIPTGVATQVDFYLRGNNGAADPNALYFIEGGNNDLLAAARITDPIQRHLAARQAADNLQVSIVKLHSAGARNFIWMNSLNIGLMPDTLAAGLVLEGHDVSWQFNSRAFRNGVSLRTLPGISLDYFDLYRLHTNLVLEHGMDALEPCMGKPAGSCDQALFFDGVHASAMMHAEIGHAVADQILGVQSFAAFSDAAMLSATSSSPEPGTGLLLIAGGLLVMGLRRRKVPTSER
jgi:phospholipase/lecithinase/hemolysin